MKKLNAGPVGRSRRSPPTAKRTASRAFGKRDYEKLAAFRLALRRFLHFTEEGARAAGITPQQHQLLLAIRGTPGRDWASIGELAASLQVRHHGAVGLVDRSERAGLVVRRRGPIDRRQVQVHLTARGERILAVLSERNRSELRSLRRALQVERLGEPPGGG